MFEIYGNLCLLLSSFGLHKVKGEKKEKWELMGKNLSQYMSIRLSPCGHLATETPPLRTRASLPALLLTRY